jgi:hypothetical protein
MRRRVSVVVVLDVVVSSSSSSSVLRFDELVMSVEVDDEVVLCVFVLVFVVVFVLCVVAGVVFHVLLVVLSVVFVLVLPLTVPVPEMLAVLSVVPEVLMPLVPLTLVVSVGLVVSWFEVTVVVVSTSVMTGVVGVTLSFFIVLTPVAFCVWPCISAGLMACGAPGLFRR